MQAKMQIARFYFDYILAPEQNALKPRYEENKQKIEKWYSGQEVWLFPVNSA